MPFMEKSGPPSGNRTTAVGTQAGRGDRGSALKLSRGPTISAGREGATRKDRDTSTTEGQHRGGVIELYTATWSTGDLSKSCRDSQTQAH